MEATHPVMFSNVKETLENANFQTSKREKDLSNPTPDALKKYMAGWDDLMGAPATTKLPRKLWSVWEQGVETLTDELNKQCLHSWKQLNLATWQQSVLAKADVYRMYPELEKLFAQEPRTVQARSDMIRLFLLAEYGGVWADASLLPILKLDSFVDHLVSPAGFFAFQFGDRGHVSTWFLASTPGNTLVVTWRDAFTQRWKSGKNFVYFEVHETLKQLVKDDLAVSAVFDKVPSVSEQWPHMCIQFSEGCANLWNAGGDGFKPPMLKRPAVDSSWWARYHAMAGV